MKKNLMFLILVMVCAATIPVFAQTPYDSFEPEQAKKEMLTMPSASFQVNNSDKKGVVGVLSLDASTMTINLMDAGNNVIKSIRLNPNDLKWTTMDPLAEKYYSISPYAYCANNPIRFIDLKGDSIDLSSMSDKERSAYSQRIDNLKSNNEMFAKLYSFLESSKNVYNISYGNTVDDNGQPIGGVFQPGKNGGSIQFQLGGETPMATLGEELFHAFQYENKGNYGQGSVNKEFEARTAVTDMEYISSTAIRGYDGMESFQDDLSVGKYQGNSNSAISPSIATSPGFLNAYNNAANSYANYNRTNNVGNEAYRVPTNTLPYSLIKLILATYGK
jgi:hypothetical protein